jgi:ferritin-like metal-binding protein YciE
MNLKDLFLDELADIHFAENHIAKALPKMAKAATCEDLKEAILSHLEETKSHIEKVKQVFAAFDEKPKSKECKATLGLLVEGDEIASDNKGEPTINAAIISACQKVEHYEIASYGSLHAWAQLLGNEKAASLIEEILDEEKAADEKLTELAGDKNEEALGGDCENCDEQKVSKSKKK